MKETFGTIKTVALRKASSMAGTELRGLTERGFAYKELEYSTLLQQNRLLSYETYIWVHSCVRAIVDQICKLPFKLYMMDGNGEPDRKQRVTSGRLWQLFRRPNAMQSYSSFMSGIVSASQLMGNVYVEKGGVDARNPSEMYMMRGDWVEIVPDPIQLVAQYLYRPNGVPIYFEPYEVAHFKLYHPRSELYGLSPLSALRMTVTTDMFVQQWQQNFFRQGGTANHYISCPTELSDVDFEALKQRMRNEYQGVDRSHLMGVLDNDMKIVNCDDESDKLDLEKLRLQLRNEVCAAYHVPTIWVMGEQHTYDNAEQQKKIGFENCIQPLCKMLEAFWDMEFLNQDGVCCEYDMSGVHSLQDNEKEKMEVLTGYVKGGVMTSNEARAALPKPLDPRADGDQLIIVGRAATEQQVDAGQVATGGGDFGKADGMNTAQAAPALPSPVPFNRRLSLVKMRKSMFHVKHTALVKAQETKHIAAIAPVLNELKAGIKKVIEANYAPVE